MKYYYIYLNFFLNNPNRQGGSEGALENIGWILNFLSSLGSV